MQCKAHVRFAPEKVHMCSALVHVRYGPIADMALLIRSPRRRVIITTPERTDLKSSRFASSEQARIWSAVRLAIRPDLLLSKRCRQGRLRADTTRANLARKP